MKALFFLVLALGTLLGSTAPVLAGGVASIEQVLERPQPGQDSGHSHCLSGYDTLPDILPLSNDNEPRPVATGQIIECPFQSIQGVFSLSNLSSSPAATTHPIRAPPFTAL